MFVFGSHIVPGKVVRHLLGFLHNKDNLYLGDYTEDVAFIYELLQPCCANSSFVCDWLKIFIYSNQKM